MLYYHGTIHKTNVLEPGFKKTGKLEKFEDEETNEFLYVTGKRSEAILQGFFSAAESVSSSVHGFSRFLARSDGAKIIIESSNPMFDIDKVLAIPLYLYSFESDYRDDLKPVLSKSNPDYPQHKTKKTIKANRLTEEVIDLRKWGEFKIFRVKYVPHTTGT